MNLNLVLAALLYFSAICYALLGARLMFGKRDVGSVAVGLTFGVIGVWVLGGAIELSASTYVGFTVDIDYAIVLTNNAKHRRQP